MRLVLKTFLLWLLVFAIPAQGYAAATMLFCGSAHRHGAEAVARAVHTQHDHAHHLHANHGPGASDPASDTSPDGAKHATSQCSACAACCIGAVLLPSVLNWSPVHDSATLAAASPATLFSGHIPDGLERPPRLSRI